MDIGGQSLRQDTAVRRIVCVRGCIAVRIDNRVGLITFDRYRARRVVIGLNDRICAAAASHLGFTLDVSARVINKGICPSF